ncbi:MAG: hypothetical protein OHK006_09980 [Thermodesulfovibrionales bacterium]
MTDFLSDLRVQTLLRGLDDREIEKIVPLVTRLSIPKDSHVFREGESCRGIYMLKSGRIEISKITPDGWKQPLLILNSGNFMGEIALLEKTSHATDALVLDSAELYLIPKELFDEMEVKESFIMLKIIKNIAIVSGMNIRRMNEKFVKALVNY